MTGPGRRFDPSELIDDTNAIDDAERLATLGIARELESLAARDARVSDSFVDRVMAAVETEPTPQPAVALGSALRRGRVAATLAALRDSFRVAFGAGRPLAVRGQALALAAVLLIGVVGLGGGAAVGAINALLPDESPQPTPSEVLPSPSPSPQPSVSPPPSPSPTETAEPTETPETPEPTETAEGTDDHGGDRTEGPDDDDSSGPGSDDSGSGSSNSGSGSSNSGSGSANSGSGDDDHEDDDHQTPEPTDEHDD